MDNKNYDAAKIIYKEVRSIGKGDNSDNLFICTNSKDEDILVKVDNDGNITQTDITPRDCKTKAGVDCVKEFRLCYSCLILVYYNKVEIVSRFTSDIIVSKKYTKSINLVTRGNNRIDIVFIEQPDKKYRMKKNSLAVEYGYDIDIPLKTGYVIGTHTGKLLKVLEGVTKCFINQKEVDLAVVYRYGDKSDYSNELKRYCVRYKDADLVTVQDIIDMYGLNYAADENEDAEDSSDIHSYTYVTNSHGELGSINNITLSVEGFEAREDVYRYDLLD